jgi:hypothetical protein
MSSSRPEEGKHDRLGFGGPGIRIQAFLEGLQMGRVVVPCEEDPIRIQDVVDANASKIGR